jgi:hypothetical protein
MNEMRRNDDQPELLQLVQLSLKIKGSSEPLLQALCDYTGFPTFRTTSPRIHTHTFS